MNFQVQILGSNAAIPAYDRHPTAQVVSIHNKHYLIDCGEGTQMRMNTFHIKKSKIEHIFISHLHGDHIFGLVGLITSYALLKRKKDLHIYAPMGIQEIIDVHLKDYTSLYTFQIHIHIISEVGLIYENHSISIEAFPLEHRIECYGFKFQEKPLQKNIIAEKIEAYSLDFKEIVRAKNGEDIQRDGEIIPNSELTHEARAPKSYAYCTDTIALESILPIISNVDLLYHEATFMHDAVERAAITYHTTTIQAAELAKKAQVKKLIIGHFSAKYKDLEPLLVEARTVFSETELAIEGEVFEL